MRDVAERAAEARQASRVLEALHGAGASPTRPAGAIQRELRAIFRALGCSGELKTGGKPLTVDGVTVRRGCAALRQDLHDIEALVSVSRFDLARALVPVAWEKARALSRMVQGGTGAE